MTMEDPYVAYKQSLNSLGHVIDRVEDTVRQGQEEARYWSKYRYLLLGRLMPGLRSWRRMIGSRWPEPNLRPIKYRVIWLNQRYTHLWLQPVVIRGRLKLAILSIEFILALVWSWRRQIARIVFIIFVMVVAFVLLITLLTNLGVILDFIREQFTL